MGFCPPFVPPFLEYDMTIGQLKQKDVKKIEHYVNELKPAEKPYIKTIPDIKGLSIRVSPKNIKSWHYIIYYRLSNGKKKTNKLSLKKIFPDYPVIKAIEYAQLLNSLDYAGIDPFDLMINGFDETEIKKVGIPGISKELLIDYKFFKKNLEESS